MDKRVIKLARHYGIDIEDAAVLVSAGLDTPRKIKADKGQLDNVNLKTAAKDKIKAR